MPIVDFIKSPIGTTFHIENNTKMADFSIILQRNSCIHKSQRQLYRSLLLVRVGTYHLLGVFTWQSIAFFNTYFVPRLSIFRTQQLYIIAMICQIGIVSNLGIQS